MRTVRKSLVGMVILALLGAMGGAVLAQDEPAAIEEVGRPDAEAPATELAPSTFVMGALLSKDIDMDEFEVSEGDGVEHLRGLRHIEGHEWSDPRLPIDGRSVWNWDAYEAGMVMSTAVLLEGPDGYWTGTATSFCDQEVTCSGMSLLTGHEAYEGLTALIASAADAGAPDTLPEPAWVYDGFIFEGEMPPFPEPLEPAAD